MTKRRIYTVSVFFTLWMLVISCRLIYLQTSQHEWLSRRARAQQLDVAPSMYYRGEIKSTNGWTLASTIPSESFYAEPREIEDIQHVALLVAPLASMDVGVLEDRLRAAKEARRGFAWLARQVSPEQAAEIRKLKLKGVYNVIEEKRIYPNNTLAASVVGLVGLDPYGLEGLEQVYNSFLKGTPGRIVYDVDARRRPFDHVETPGERGSDLITSLDEALQMKAEILLDTALLESGARSATAIILDPKTGEILTLANAPSYDPNQHPRVAINDSPRVNRGISNMYESGATYEVVVLSALLEEEYGKNSTLNCLKNRVLVSSSPFNSLDAQLNFPQRRGFNASCTDNIRVAALRLGDRRLSEYIRRFSFGEKTGVDLPGESAGSGQNTFAWRLNKGKSYDVGYGIGATPLQMAAAMATVANGGVWVQPHMVRKAISDSKGVVYESRPVYRRVLSERTSGDISELLSKNLHGAVIKEFGDLKEYGIVGLASAVRMFDTDQGKYSNTRFALSVVGYTPSSNPKFTIIILLDDVENNSFTESIAIKTFGRIIKSVHGGYSLPPVTD